MCSGGCLLACVMHLALRRDTSSRRLRASRHSARPEEELEAALNPESDKMAGAVFSQAFEIVLSYAAMMKAQARASSKRAARHVSRLIVAALLWWRDGARAGARAREACCRAHGSWMRCGLVCAFAGWRQQSFTQQRARRAGAKLQGAMTSKRLKASLQALQEHRMHARARRTAARWVDKYAASLCEACLSTAWMRWGAKAAATKSMRGQRCAGDTSSVPQEPRDYYLRMTIETHKEQMRVKSVEPGSACEGVLQPGDQILSIDGQQPRAPAHLREICRGTPGTIVAIKYVRAPTSKWRSEEVLEHLLLRWSNQQGQPIFTKYIPATPRQQAGDVQARR